MADALSFIEFLQAFINTFSFTKRKPVLKEKLRGCF
jgi:hypothetical protein